jgi:phosphohistidine phosphatase SixA
MNRGLRSVLFGALLLAVATGSSGAPTERGELAELATVVIVVRHAEAGETRGQDSEGNSPDPGLSEIGLERSKALAELLADSGVTHLFATEHRRTQDTLQPLAERFGLVVEIIPGGESAAQIERLRELPERSVAVVAGHSNTVPAIVRGLGGELSGTRQTEHGEMIDQDSYDRLFFVTLTTSPSLLELSYGP